MNDELRTELLLQTSDAWDGSPYECYPQNRPQISVLRVSLAPYASTKWHSHPGITVGYVLSGCLTIETVDGKSGRFTSGHAVAETTMKSHRGIAGKDPVEAIVFCVGHSYPIP